MAVYGGGNGCIVAKAADLDVSNSGGIGMGVGAVLGLLNALRFRAVPMSMSLALYLTMPPLVGTTFMVFVYFLSLRTKDQPNRKDQAVSTFYGTLVGLLTWAISMFLMSRTLKLSV